MTRPQLDAAMAPRVVCRACGVVFTWHRACDCTLMPPPRLPIRWRVGAWGGLLLALAVIAVRLYGGLTP